MNENSDIIQIADGLCLSGESLSFQNRDLEDPHTASYDLTPRQADVLKAIVGNSSLSNQDDMPSNFVAEIPSIRRAFAALTGNKNISIVVGPEGPQIRDYRRPSMP